VSETPKSPMHPKALSLPTVMMQAKGDTLMLCRHDPEAFVATDAVRILGTVEMCQRGRLIESGRLIVIDPAPDHFKQTVENRFRCPWYPLGRSVGWRDYRGLRANEVPYSEPRMSHGFAVKAYTLGLMPDPRGQWSPYWLMRVSDL
jgi:hypothetical protein